MKHILNKFFILFLLLCNTVLLPEEVPLSLQKSFYPIVSKGIKISDNDGAQCLDNSAIPVSFSIKNKHFRTHKTTRLHRSLDRMSTEELFWYFALLSAIQRMKFLGILYCTCMIHTLRLQNNCHGILNL